MIRQNFQSDGRKILGFSMQNVIVGNEASGGYCGKQSHKDVQKEIRYIQ